MAINTGSFAKALWPGVNAWYGKAYAEYGDEWKGLFDEKSSTQNYEEDVGVSSFGLAPEKPQGQAFDYDTERQGFTTRYVHTTYGIGFIVTREAFEDDLYNVVGERKAKGLAFSVKTTLNTLGANVYNNAVTAGYTGGDGSLLLVDDHPNVAGGTQSNLSAATLSEAALESGCIAISKWTNDRGLRINLKPMSLIIPPDLMFDAQRILMSELRVNTANNDTNALKDKGIFPNGYTVNHYITGTTSWYIRTNCPDGMKTFNRRAPQFAMDNDFDTENAKFKATFRRSFGWTDWRGLFGYDV